MGKNDLIGKTIADITQLRLRGYDDEGYLLIRFTDGDRVLITGGYGNYTGESEDEYQTVITVSAWDAKNDPKRFEPIR